MYSLSFPELEEQLNDRDSFRRFVGLRAGEPVPDFSTFHKLRDRLAEAGLLDRLFDEVSHTIEQHGLLLKQGTLIDATLIDSCRKQPPKPEAEGPEESPIPPESEPLPPRSQRDRDATEASKRGRRYYGYKCHAAVDRISWLIRKQCVTTARPHDITAVGALLCGDEQALFADRAFDATWLHQYCDAHSIGDGIMRQNRTKSERREGRYAAANAGFEYIRKPVERVFAVLKHIDGHRKMWALTLPRNAAAFTLWCTGYNLKRMAVLFAG
jgi:IS5 family transposase